MSKNQGPNKKNLEKTRKVFLKEAYKEFTNHGYAEASTNRIVDATGMARGSLYYHFKDKKGLFTAVYADLLEDLHRKINTEMNKCDHIWSAFKKGCETYIRLCMNTKTRRLLIEANTVLGYKERIDIQREGMLGALQEHLDALIKRGYFKNHTRDTASIAVYGMITEAARSFEMVEKPEQFCDVLVGSCMEFLDKMAR